MQSDTFTIESLLRSEIPLKDKYWFVIKKCNLTTEQKQQIAVSAADIVLPIYEQQHPGDSRVRDCMEATKLFLTGHITIEQLMIKKADAAAAAAYAAAYAAADTAAAADAGIKQKLLDYLLDFVENSI